VLALLLLGGGPAAADFTATVSKVAPLTGPTAPGEMKTPDICGTDLGIVTETPSRLYFAFGDTFGYAGNACPRFGPDWRSNVFAHTSDRDPGDGIALDGWLTDPATGRAKAVTEGKHQPAFAGEQTRIPTALLAVGDALYLHFMSVHGFAARGGVWDCNFSRFASSADGGESWREATQDFGDAKSPFDMLALASAPVGGDGYVYALGTPCGRFGGAHAGRVKPADILDPAGWRYFDGKAWVAGQDRAAEVIPAPVGEGSLAWNPGLGQWMFTSLNEQTARIELRLAPRPEGPWGEAIPLARSKDYPALYGAFLTPAFIASDGMSFYFVMSQFGPYNTFIMHAVLRRASPDQGAASARGG